MGRASGSPFDPASAFGELVDISRKSGAIRCAQTAQGYETVGGGTSRGGSARGDKTAGRFLVGCRSDVGIDGAGSTPVWTIGRNGF